MLSKFCDHSKHAELLVTYKDYIETFNSLYQLKSENEEEIRKLYNKIKTYLIDTKYFDVAQIITIVSKIIKYRNGYLKSYFTLFKMFYEEYHPKYIHGISQIFDYFVYKEYGFVFNRTHMIFIKNLKFHKQSFSLDVHEENTIYRLIMKDDKEHFIAFTESPGFDDKQILKSELYPINRIGGYNLLELCCYHGAVNCFKFLRTKYNFPITNDCLRFSFLSGNPDILSECMKVVKPDNQCMEYAIISHNIDFVCFLMSEHFISIFVNTCCEFKNLQAFLVYLDQTNNIKETFPNSTCFNIPSLCKYLIKYDVDTEDIKESQWRKNRALYHAVEGNSIETVKFLLNQGANINKPHVGLTELHVATINNCKEMVELLLSHGAPIDEKIGIL